VSGGHQGHTSLFDCTAHLQEIPVDATSRSHVFPRPVRHGRRLLSSLQHLRPVCSCVRRLLVRQSVHHRGAVLPQVPNLQARSSFLTFRRHPHVAATTDTFLPTTRARENINFGTVQTLSEDFAHPTIRVLIRSNEYSPHSAIVSVQKYPKSIGVARGCSGCTCTP